MDQRVCAEVNNLSDLRAGTEIREDKIKELTEELRRMKQLEMNSPEQQEAEQVKTYSSCS